MDRKADIRRQVRLRRKAYVETYEKHVYLALQFSALLNTRPSIAAYIATGYEADPMPLIDAAREAGCIIALPRLADDPSQPMRFLRHDGHNQLETGPHGILQPLVTAAEVAPDIILLPLVAFDRRGTRLGQGGGHYDRTLPLFPAAQRIGIALSVQEVDDLPVDPWDMPLNAIITEREWIIP